MSGWPFRIGPTGVAGNFAEAVRVRDALKRAFGTKPTITETATGLVVTRARAAELLSSTGLPDSHIYDNGEE